MSFRWEERQERHRGAVSPTAVYALMFEVKPSREMPRGYCEVKDWLSWRTDHWENSQSTNFGSDIEKAKAECLRLNQDV